MKTDLEILIEHLQAEFDYLKSSMDECIAEWDFDGAKTFRESLIYTRGKLDVLKCLKNPNYTKISRLKATVLRLEKSLDESKYEMNFLDEQSRIRMEQYFKESTKKRIQNSKNELDNLNSFVPEQRNDSDEILKLLEELEQNGVGEIEFEIRKDKVFLLLRVDGQNGEFLLRSSDNRKVEHFLVDPTKSILKRLGFDMETLKLQILNYKEMNKIKLLEELSIIYFEVFSIFGKEVKIKIDRNPTDTT